MAMHNLALALGNIGRYDEGLAYLRRALVVSPKDEALTKLEFRLRVLKLRAKVAGILRRALRPLGRAK